MRMTEVHFDPKLVFGPSDISGAVRTPGLHVSQIYESLDRVVNGEPDPLERGVLDSYAAGGFLWEHVIEDALVRSQENEFVQRPGEYVRDGIICSPDLLNVVDARLLEVKCTWRSVRKWECIERYFWKWIVQIKAYSWVLEVTDARLLALFIVGDWQGSGPQFKALDFEFTEAELAQNWSMLCRHAVAKGWMPKPKMKIEKRM